MRITFLLTQSLESPSGLGRYWPLSKELARLGHKVTVLALHHDFRALKQRGFIKDGVKVIYVGQMHVWKRGNYKLYFSPTRLLGVSFLGTLRLMAAALRISTDVYHVCKPHPMNGLTALLLHLLGRPVYLDCDDYEAASNRFSGEWQRWIVSSFEDHLPAISAGITVNTRFTLERLRELGYQGNRIFYVPNGVDRSRFSNTSDMDAQTLRRRLGLVNRKVIIYVGSMSLTSHAVDLLLEGFARVEHLEHQATLVLVGGGEDYERLRKQAQMMGLQEVHFIGRVPPEEVPLYYRLADVSVDPVRGTLAELARFPLKVVESFAAGTPVVTGKVGDRIELLAHGGGLLVTPNDPQSLADALLAVLCDPDMHTRFMEETLAVRERFYWDRLIYDFIRVYN